MQKKDTIKRYTLFQIPGLLITFLVLTLIHYFVGLPFWVFFAVMAVAIIKDVIMFHYTWTAYIVHRPEDYANIKGKLCIAIADFDDEGLVQINGELWKAKCGASVQKGDELLIKKINGLEIFVEKKTTG